jgi:hypothetical protein
MNPNVIIVPLLPSLFLATALAACGGTGAATGAATTGPTPDSTTASPPATGGHASATDSPRATPASRTGADLNAPLPPLPARPAPTPPPAACTELACLEGYQLRLTAQRWNAGDHVVVLTLDGVKVTCRGNLHLKPDEGSIFTCDRDIADGHHFVGDADTGTLSIRLRGAPRRISVDVSAGTTLVTHQDLVPTYRWVLPNGPGCGGECLQASDDVTI